MNSTQRLDKEQRIKGEIVAYSRRPLTSQSLFPTPAEDLLQVNSLLLPRLPAASGFGTGWTPAEGNRRRRVNSKYLRGNHLR
jgi:hypothetical protein